MALKKHTRNIDTFLIVSKQLDEKLCFFTHSKHSLEIIDLCFETKFENKVLEKVIFLKQEKFLSEYKFLCQALDRDLKWSEN